MTSNVTLSAAALAGLLSFLSPCVLPLVPPYLTFIAGAGLEELVEGGERRARRDTLIAAILFVLGFSTVFVVLGATASALGQTVRAYLPVFTMLAGLAIIGMGLHFLGRVPAQPALPGKTGERREADRALGRLCDGAGLRLRLDALHRADPRRHPRRRVVRRTVTRGAGLLAVYSFGLGLPFLLAAIAMEPFVHFLKRFKAHFGKVERIVGVLLVVTGVLFLTGGIQSASFWLLQTFPGLANLG